MWGSPSWSIRRLKGHIDALPPSSAYARKYTDGWTQDTHFAAGLFDQLRVLTYTVQVALGGKPDAPESFPRPGAKPQHDDSIDPGSFMTLLKGGLLD